MSILTRERLHQHQAESAGELFIRRQKILAKAVLPIVNEAAHAPYIEVEDALSSLTSTADKLLQDHRKPSRRIRRKLSRYAHRMLEITEEQPDLLAPRSIDLVGRAADATGKRDLLETTLEQAHRADKPFDTNMNLQAIEDALRQDIPFTEAMIALNTAAKTTAAVRDSGVEISDEYAFLTDRSVRYARPVTPTSAIQEIKIDELMTVDEAVWGKTIDPLTGNFTKDS